MWRVQRVAANKSHHFNQIKQQLERYIQKKRVVKEDEQITG